MQTTMKFLPVRKADVLAYATQVHEVLAATGFVPASLGLTAADVTELGTLVTAAQTAHDEVNATRLQVKAKTQALSAPDGALELLKAKLRDIANAARVSSASDNAVAAIGVNRRDPSPTPKNPPADPPEFSVESVAPGVINIRFRTAGSARPRARAENTSGVQIAVVNGANPAADGEADTVPPLIVTRSPATLDSKTMPDKVRLYARWVTPRGLTSPWTRPQEVSVL
jgi:hypothetical protein